MADLKLTKEQAQEFARAVNAAVRIGDPIDEWIDANNLPNEVFRADESEAWVYAICRAVVAALDPPTLKVGDRVEWARDRGCGGIFTENAAGVWWDAGLFSYHPLSDLRRVEEEKP